jgi:hypothetical protein
MGLVMETWQKKLRIDIKLTQIICLDALHRWYRGRQRNKGPHRQTPLDLSRPWQNWSQGSPAEEIYIGSTAYKSVGGVARLIDTELFVTLNTWWHRYNQGPDAGDEEVQLDSMEQLLRAPWHHSPRLSSLVRAKIPCVASQSLVQAKISCVASQPTRSSTPSQHVVPLRVHTRRPPDNAIAPNGSGRVVLVPRRGHDMAPWKQNGQVSQDTASSLQQDSQAPVTGTLASGVPNLRTPPTPPPRPAAMKRERPPSPPPPCVRRGRKYI